MKAYEVIEVCAEHEFGDATALMVFWRVALYASGTEGVCFASVDTLHHQTRLGIRTVQRALRSLVEAGMLDKLEQPGRTTEYRVPPPPWHPRHGGTPVTVAPAPVTVAPAPVTVAPAPVTVAPDPEFIRSSSGVQTKPVRVVGVVPPAPGDLTVEQLAGLQRLEQEANPEAWDRTGTEAHAVLRRLVRDEGFHFDALVALFEEAKLRFNRAPPTWRAIAKAGWSSMRADVLRRNPKPEAPGEEAAREAAHFEAMRLGQEEARRRKAEREAERQRWIERARSKAAK